MLQGLLLISLACDVVTLKSGEQLECLVVHIDDRAVKLRRGTEGVSVTRELSRTEITEIRLSTPDVAGLRSVARRFESSACTREATEIWRELCVLRPEGVPDQLKLAQAYRKAGRLDDAAMAALTAARADATHAGVPLEQGEIALAAGDGPGAVSFAREHLRLSPAPSADGAWLLGRSLELSGLADDALQEYRRLLRLDPNRGDLLDRFVDLSLARKKGEQAVPELERLAQPAGAPRSWWIALGRLLYRLDRLPDAETAFRKATSLGGSDYNRARIYFQCTLARRHSRNPEAVLPAADLKVAADLDPALRRETP
jgi:tetratricopeptide (TPR) repeat protein